MQRKTTSNNTMQRKTNQPQAQWLHHNTPLRPTGAALAHTHYETQLKPGDVGA